MKNVKLNDEQIEYLKKQYLNKFCCLSRDKDGTLFVSEYIPIGKYHKNWRHAFGYKVEEVEDVFFEFVQWEDKEPFYFADLFEVVYKGEVE